MSNIPVEHSGLVFNFPECYDRLSPDLLVKQCPIRKSEGMVEFKSIYAGKEHKTWLDWARDKESTKDAKVLQESKSEPGKLVVKTTHPWVQQAECKYTSLFSLLFFFLLSLWVNFTS